MLSPGKTKHRLCYNFCSCHINYRLIWTVYAINNLKAHPVEFIVWEIRNRFCIFVSVINCYDRCSITADEGRKESCSMWSLPPQCQPGLAGSRVWYGNTSYFCCIGVSDYEVWFLGCCNNRVGTFSTEQLSSLCSRQIFSNFKERDDDGERSLDAPVNC